MSTENIISLADKRASRPAKVEPPKHSGPPLTPAQEFGMHLRAVEEAGHRVVATMIPPDETVGALREMIEEAYDAGWTTSAISPSDHDAGLCLRFEVAIAILDGGAQ